MPKGWSRGDFVADKNQGNVVIEAEVNERGQLRLPDGRPLPTLIPGHRVQIRIAKAALHTNEDRRALQDHQCVPLLPGGDTVWVIVDLQIWHDEYLRDRMRDTGYFEVAKRAWRLREDAERHSASMPPLDGHGPHLKHNEGLIPVQLLKPLHMERTGQKAWRLRRCDCQVPEDWEMPGSNETGMRTYISLNHALTALSERLELHRISHTGNAFGRFLAMNRALSSPALSRLARLRDDVVAIKRAPLS